MPRKLLAVCFVLTCSTVLHAQVPSDATPRVLFDISGVVKAGTKIELVKDRLNGADDPIAFPDGSVAFTEPNANRVLRVDQNNQVSTLVENSNGSLGMSFDPKGRLIAAQSTPGNTKVAVIYPFGREAIIADTVDGVPFSRPNDLIVDKKGGVYVTDPGLTGIQAAQLQQAQGGRPLPAQLSPAVYYIPAGGRPIKIADGIERPNGVTLSRDEKTLYINNTNGVYLLAFDIQPDGTVRNRRNLGTYEGRSEIPNGIPGVMSGADGLTIDNEGRLYAVTAAGIEIFSAQGTHLGTIRMSCGGMYCQGIAFGGPQKKALYIAGRGSLWKIQMLSQGFTGRAK